MRSARPASNSSVPALKTGDLILAVVVLLVAIAYALINLYLYTHIDSRQ